MEKRGKVLSLEDNDSSNGDSGGSSQFHVTPRASHLLELNREEFRDSSGKSEEKKDKLGYKENSMEDFYKDDESATAPNPLRHLPSVKPKKRGKALNVTVVLKRRALPPP